MYSFLGVDLGATKTDSLIVDETGRVLGMEAVTPEIRSAMNKSISILKNMAMR